MSDQDIIDTMAVAIWGVKAGSAVHIARSCLAALHAAGYVIKPQYEIDELWEMLIYREDRIDGEWGNGNTPYEQLRKELEDELALNLHRRRHGKVTP